jgi:hypothetical protein
LELGENGIPPVFDLSDQIVLVLRFATIGLCSDKISLYCSLIDIKAIDFRWSALQFFLSSEGKTVSLYSLFLMTTFLRFFFFASSCSLFTISGV